MTLPADPRLPSRSHFVFDLDGTLVDTAPDILALLSGVLHENGYPHPPLSRGLIGPPLEDMVRGICPGLGEEERRRLVLVYRRRYRECDYALSAVFPGLVPLLERLRAAGGRLYVATNKPEAVSRRLLGIKGLGFDDIVSADSVPGKRLSKEDMLRLLMERHGFGPERGVMTGDSALDVEGARKAGLLGVAALYGYGRAEALLGAEPDFIVDDAGWRTLRPRERHGS